MITNPYIPIRLCTLRGDLKIPFDLFIHVAGKFILYCRKGSSFEGERLFKLKEKKLQRLYIAAEDESLYRDYLRQNLEVAYKQSSNKTIDIRAQIIQGVQQAAVEDALEHPESEGFYQVLKEGVAPLLDFLQTEDKALSALLNIPNLDQNIAHHGVNVAVLALSLAMNIYQEDDIDIPSLGVGAMIHDLGHQDHEINLSQPLSQLKKQELDIYRSHPLLGGKKVSDLYFYSPIVLDIITKHEEHIDGSGYPSQLKEGEIGPEVMLVSVANYFDRLYSFEDLSPQDAFKKLFIDKMGASPLSFLQSFQRLLKEKAIID